MCPFHVWQPCIWNTGWWRYTCEWDISKLSSIFITRFTNYSNYGWNKHVLTPSCWAMCAVRTVCMLLFELVLFSYRVQHLHICKLPGIMIIFRYWSLWLFSWCTEIDFYLDSHQFPHILVCALMKCLIRRKRKLVFNSWFKTTCDKLHTSDKAFNFPSKNKIETFWKSKLHENCAAYDLLIYFFRTTIATRILGRIPARIVIFIKVETEFA